MFVLGIQGSPRRKGNTSFLVSSFLNEARNLGANTELIDISDFDIKPCIGCAHCEKKGFCFIKNDDMTLKIKAMLRRADVVVAGTPIYFYSAPSQMKALIDRSQALWSRKYRLRLKDPGSSTRVGFLLALGATKGKNLFNGMELTAKYFFDAIDASFEGSLTYRRIENPGDMEKHPQLSVDIKTKAAELITALCNRKKVLFACRENSCRSQMAWAFTKLYSGDKFDASSAGSTPIEKINPLMVEVMEEKGIDMAYVTTRSLNEAVETEKPDLIVTMGCGEECPYVPGVTKIDWDIPDPAGKSLEFMRRVRDEIEEKVRALG